MASPYYARSLRPPKTDRADAMRRVAFLERCPPPRSLAAISQPDRLPAASRPVVGRCSHGAREIVGIVQWRINPHQCRLMCCVLFSVIYFRRIKTRYVILYKMRFNKRNSWLSRNANSLPKVKRKKNFSKQ